MRRYRLYVILFGLFIGTHTISSQNKQEREHRIRKSQFPEKALNFVSEQLKEARQIKFYKEIDGAKRSYEVKFKKDRLKYSVEFDENGDLEDVEINIKKIDIPEDSWNEMNTYFTQKFEKFRIRKIQQQYPVSAEENTQTTLKNAFQNLIIPSINYEYIVAGKEKKKYELFEVLFNSEGAFISIRKSLPANYDHVLY